MLAAQLAVAQRSALPGALLPAPHEIEEPLRGERLTRKTDCRDRALNGGRIAFDLDEVIHPRVALEAHGRAMEVVLADVAVDLADDHVSKTIENVPEGVGIR